MLENGAIYFDTVAGQAKVYRDGEWVTMLENGTVRVNSLSFKPEIYKDGKWLQIGSPLAELLMQNPQLEPLLRNPVWQDVATDQPRNPVRGEEPTQRKIILFEED